jgi:membrane protease YdiL (CAAX protease family)
VLAIARRDLASEMKDRRGWFLPAIMAGLLLPASTLSGGNPGSAMVGSVNSQKLMVAGDVPEAVLQIERVEHVEGPAHLIFRARPDDALVVRGLYFTEEIREALDQGPPDVERIVVAERKFRPGRSLLFALLSASTLTGAVAASVGGERSSKTLVALLAAAVTRLELVLGKWLAWGGLGAVASLLAAGTAVLAGTIEPGWWLLPLPMVPLGTVAFGIWLVRKATDVIAGTAISLRVVPAMIAGAGLVAWFLGNTEPLLGAAIPFGGALLAAGDTWPGVLPPLVATASTGLATLAALSHTAATLEDEPSEPQLGVDWTAATRMALFGIMAAIAPIVGPTLWAAAGNPSLETALEPSRGATAAGAALLLLAATAALRRPGPAAALGLARPPVLALPAAVAVGAILAYTLHDPVAPIAPGPHWTNASGRLAASLTTGSILLALGHEAYFRGILLRRFGPVVAWLGGAAALAPTDPIRGLLVSGALVGLATWSGSTWVSLTAMGTLLAMLWGF